MTIGGVPPQLINHGLAKSGVDITQTTHRAELSTAKMLGVLENNPPIYFDMMNSQRTKPKKKPSFIQCEAPQL